MNYEEQQELLSVLRELHNLSGFRISIHDTDFREIAAYPRELFPYCRLVQSTQQGRERCMQNDRNAFLHVQKKQKPHLYKCRFGLSEAVAPLFVFGNLVGYLMMGQSADNHSHSRDELFQQALSVLPHQGGLAEAVAAVPRYERDKILSCMKILDICAQYITLSNRFVLDKNDMASRIKQYLDENYAENITIDKICLAFFCSRTTVTRTFREKYGMGLIQYLTLVRIQTAKRLLRGTSKTIGEIAEHCGYPDQNYFCKVFSKHCNVTPTAYRESAAS